MAVSKNRHKPFGIDLDPNNDLTHKTLPDGDVKVTHKGEEIKYMDYIDVMEERTTRYSEGKKPVKSALGTFSGWGKGTLSKPYNTK